MTKSLDETLMEYLVFLENEGGKIAYDIDDEAPLGARLAQATGTVHVSKVGSWGMYSNQFSLTQEGRKWLEEHASKPLDLQA